jgi:hypothetical protein
MISSLWESIWLVPLYAALLTAAVVFGRRLARREEGKLGAPRECRVGPFERSVGAMVAFLIGFTFAMSGSNFREAQAGLHRESDGIAEAQRWGRMLPEADRKWLLDNLRSYTDRLLRYDNIPTAGPEAEAADRDIRSGQWQLWDGLVSRRNGAGDRASYDPCLRAVNQFIQAYELRYALSRRRLPALVVVFMLGALLIIGFLVGYTSELKSKHFIVMASLFVLFISATIYLIWEVDRPSEGLITISRQDLIDVAGRLREEPPE